MKATVTVLGSGTSHGVPMIGCTCAVCQSHDPRDRRLRASIYLTVDDGPSILIDTSTDLRQQALANGITRVDAILFTHPHADHIMGLDDTRPFSHASRGAVPCFADARTNEALRTQFPYVFDPNADKGGGLPQVSLHTVTGPFGIGPVRVVPLVVHHGNNLVLGFRIGGLAYVPDCNGVPDATWPLLEGLDVLILDALRREAHPTHFTVAEALQVVARVQPRQTYFTHMCHKLPHAETNASLPAGVELAYDGLVVTIDAGAPSTSAEAAVDTWT